MLGQPEEVDVIINGKLGQHFPMNRNFEAMKAVAQSCIEKSLKSFESVLQTYPKGSLIKIFCLILLKFFLELGEDAIVQSHFGCTL